MYKRQILRAARDLFADPEGDDPKVSDIAQAATCSTATIHNHFPNAVPDILGAITSELMDAAYDRYKTTAAELSGLDLPRAYVQAVSDEFYKAGDLAVVMVRASVDQATDSPWPWGLGYETTVDCYDEAAEDDDLPGTSADLAEITHIHFYGSLYLWALGRLDSDKFLQSAKSSVDLAINALQVSR